MHRELVSYRLAVCLIFPIGPELRHARFPLPPPCAHMCACLPSPFSPSSLPSFTPLRVPARVPLPSSLPLAPRGAARPIKESRPTPVCAPDTIASLFPSSRTFGSLLPLSLRRRLVRRFLPYTPFVFSSVALGHREPPPLRQNAFHPGTTFCICVLAAGWKRVVEILSVAWSM